MTAPTHADDSPKPASNQSTPSTSLVRGRCHPTMGGGGRRILLVDDEDDVRGVAQVSLELFGDFEVLTASNGHDGIDVARTSRPDAILLDAMMPDVDGLQVFEKLRPDPATREIPVLFLTARTRPDDLKQLADLGAAGILAKPFDPLRLSEDVASILGW